MARSLYRRKANPLAMQQHRLHTRNTTDQQQQLAGGLPGRSGDPAAAAPRGTGAGPGGWHAQGPHASQESADPKSVFPAPASPLPRLVTASTDLGQELGTADSRDPRDSLGAASSSSNSYTTFASLESRQESPQLAASQQTQRSPCTGMAAGWRGSVPAAAVWPRPVVLLEKQQHGRAKAAGPSGSSPASGPSGSSPAAGPSDSSCSNKRPPADIGSGLADKRVFQFDPATQMGMGLDPGAIQAVSAALGVWDEDGCLESFHSSKLTRSQVQHDSGLIQARCNTQRWNDYIKLELQHLAAATPTGTSLVVIQRHVAVTLATWDAVWGEYLHPKWAEQRMRLYGAQEKVLERYFKKDVMRIVCILCAMQLEEEAAMVSQQRWGTRKQLVVFFGNAGISTLGGWGAKAVLQACRKVVERPNSGKPTDRVPGKVVTVDEFRTSRVSSAMNIPQPCDVGLDRSKPTRPEGWKPGHVQHRLLRSAWSKRFEAPVRTPEPHVVP
ncbi:hypothetical protein QJQ45_006869 [Haematococcus lacustris]|nr:hypothetical protein QJQ45_006869 [Haematococcus lacustris]